MSYMRPQALSGLTSRVVGRRLVNKPVAIVQLGDDAEPAVDMPEAQWRAKMLAEQSRLAAAADRWVSQDKQIRYLQIGATLMIPVAGAMWKFILGRRSVSSSLSL